jgi:SAM-dependent methyltransferase
MNAPMFRAAARSVVERAVRQLASPPQSTEPPEGKRIDIGCGAKKREGFIGVDFVPAPGVDIVCDVEREALPFPDQSVGFVHSSHCFEHLRDWLPLLREIARVAVDGCRIELWTPNAWHSDTWLPGHVTPVSIEAWLHIGYRYREFWQETIGVSLRLDELVYVIGKRTLADLLLHGIRPSFALRYLHDVAPEIGAVFTVERTRVTPSAPRISWSVSRDPTLRVRLSSRLFLHR